MKQIIIGIAIILGIMYLLDAGENKVRIIDVGDHQAISFDRGKTFDLLD